VLKKKSLFFTINSTINNEFKQQQQQQQQQQQHLQVLRIGMMIEQDEMLRLSTKTKINDQVDRNHHQSERDTEKKKKKKEKKKEKRGKR
jgi:hypothetical protein